MQETINQPGQVSPEWLTKKLQDNGYLSNGHVVDIEYDVIGTGKMGDNARFRISYNTEEGKAPATLIGKFPAQDETARMMAGAQGAYYSEVMFYRHLAARTAMRTPTIYASEIANNRSDFVLLMEDMSPAQPGSQLRGEPLAHARLVMQQAAKLASAFYGDESIGALDHVMTMVRDDGGAFGGELLTQEWPKFRERFGEQISAECLAFAEQYVQQHLRFVNRYKGPKTLVHGDLRSENILFHGSTACTVDWQTVSESSPLTDFAYFMGGSVDVGDRRAWERDLVAEYSEELARLGVKIAPGDCWNQYREQTMHGLMITILGACFSAPAERSDAMFLAMIQRHLQHCVDLDATEFLN
ncbi:MAG: ecdysteroid 22-kinase family protein [Gammaproteobacteria bacterium]|nr:ecdysteroid 22-kinase family protein [Gammaproteobacteria bacterium]NND39319.1 phosphotransferase [Pseudomonadales bacterium]RZV50257.1 MAG: DUF1679 domain-containing protein [Pseudomonadales bacterium]